MNAAPRTPVASPIRPAARAAEASRRAVYRDRAPGVGYGNSSGYATDRRYAQGWNGEPRFRCG